MANPYVDNQPAQTFGQISGHLDHTGPVFNFADPSQTPDWGDIIPEFTYEGQTYSLNWTTYGQQVWAAGCQAPTTTTTTTTPTTTTTTPGQTVTVTATVTQTVTVPTTVTVTTGGTVVTVTQTATQPGSTITQSVTQPGSTVTVTVTGSVSALTGAPTITGSVGGLTGAPSLPPTSSAGEVTGGGVMPSAILLVLAAGALSLTLAGRLATRVRR